MFHRTLRLSLIPASLDKICLRQYLNSLEVQTRSTKENILAFSLAPYIDWLVATVTFDQEPYVFLLCSQEKPLPLKLPAELGGATIHVDCNFYGMTPLYHPPSEPKYDVVAVSGLAAHAFGSWKSPLQCHVMWLRDILRLDFPHFRVLSWGYESDLRDNTTTSSIADFSRQLLTAVHTARDVDESKDSNLGRSRPLIFVGHSLGGLVIKHALVEAAQGNSEADLAILHSCVGLLLFGVPNRGLNNENLLSLVKGKKNEPFVYDLMEGSALLHSLHIAFLRSYRSGLRSCFVASFFETRDTQTVEEITDGAWRRSGKPIRLVTRESATWFMPDEEVHNQIPIVTDHAKLVKFKGRDDQNYLNVRSKLREAIRKTPEILEQRTGYNTSWAKPLPKTKYMKLDPFVRLLSEHNQEKHLRSLSPFDWDSPKLYWISRNIEFTKWSSTDGPSVLWISGPSQCRLNQVASYIIYQAKATVSSSLSSVLYFFCSTIAGKQWSLLSAVQAILYQFLLGIPRNKQKDAIKIFQRTIMDAERSRNESIVERKRVKHEFLTSKKPTIPTRNIPELNTLEPDITELLSMASDPVLLEAIKNALDIDQKLDWTIIVDGVDKVTHKKEDFIKSVFEINNHLLKRQSKVKMLLTSQSEFEIRAQLPNIVRIKYDAERKAYLKTLQFRNTRYEKITSEHSGSLEWFWMQEQYRKWSDSDCSYVFYIQGKPGSGKSTLMKYIKDHLLKHEPDAKTAIVASFFYSYREGGGQTSHYNMLRSILYDILYQNESFLYHFQPEFRKYQAQLRVPGHGTLSELDYGSLKNILRSIKTHDGMERIYLLIDAVDESTYEDRRDILKLLFDLCSDSNCCIIKVIVTSRPVVDLEARMQASIKLQDLNKSDIQKFVDACLGPELKLPEEVCRQAAEYILTNAQGVFLWVRLIRVQLERYLERGYSKSEILYFLESLPTELEGLYQRILNDLAKNDKGDVAVGKIMFQLVLVARRPLRVLEFQHALAITNCADTGLNPSDGTFRDDLIVDIGKRIIHCSGNLLEIKGRDEPVVQVMHQTVREFFLGLSSDSTFGIIENNAHVRIATNCIRYLIFWATSSDSWGTQLTRIETWSSTDFKNYVGYLNDRPLLNYALSHLQDHLDKCHGAANLPNLVSQLVMQLTACNPSSSLLAGWITSHLNKTLLSRALGERVENFIDWVLLSIVKNRRIEAANKFRNKVLWFAARTGFNRAAEVALTAGAQVESHNPPLAAQTKNYFEASVRLLGYNADIEAKDIIDDRLDCSRTALHLAAEHGHKAMVRLLLDHKANIETRNTGRRTALHLPAANGHEATVQFILDRKANIEANDYNHSTALHLAAANGHKTTVRLLLDYKATIEAQDDSCRTALHLAAEKGHLAIVWLLCDREANVEAQDHSRRTTLHLAAANGYLAMVRLLLDLEATIEARDSRRYTALHLAGAHGHEATARLLLDSEANIEAQDNSRRTVLHRAAENGHEDMVRLFLDHEANIEAQDDGRSTALHLAAENGHETTVQLLLDHKANIEAQHSGRRTALHLAAANGHKATVQLLLDYKANIEAHDYNQGTALHLAAGNGHKTTVCLLLDREAKIEAQDDNSFTALHLATANGHLATVQLLLDRKANIEALHYNQGTVLHLATANGHKSAVRLLLDHKVKIETQYDSHRRALHLTKK